VSEKEGDVAAVLSETVRSAPFIPPPDYWRRVRMACDKHGALLILDELPTGLGRTGKRFACEHYGIVPDMLVLGKALGGGVMPLAALIARDSLNVAADRALGHYTHQKNPIAAAAALARLRDMQSRHPIIGDRCGGSDHGSETRLSRTSGRASVGVRRFAEHEPGPDRWGHG
jgi:4-aminobutyrate aminotransferase